MSKERDDLKNVMFNTAIQRLPVDELSHQDTLEIYRSVLRQLIDHAVNKMDESDFLSNEKRLIAIKNSSIVAEGLMNPNYDMYEELFQNYGASQARIRIMKRLKPLCPLWPFC